MAIATVTTIAGAEKMTCAAGESVECGFNVSNEAARSVRLSIETRTEGGTQEDWLEVLGDIEREFPGSGSDQVTVRVKLPKDTPEGKYAFRLRVYATDEPEQFAESPAVAVQVPAPAEPRQKEEPKKPFPWWIVAVAVAVLVIGGVVTAILISGPPTVPAVAGMPLDKAIEALEDAKLSVGDVTEKVSGETDAGSVISSDPPADTEVEKGSTVSLAIEAISVEVPALTRMRVAEADEALVAAGLVLGEKTWKQSGGAGGTIIAQAPAAGDRVLPGTAINITAVEASTTVPSVVGQTVSGARQTFTGLGLRLGRTTSRRAGGTPGVVLSHTPAASQKVKPGTQINLVIEEQKVAVPNVVKKTQKAATSTLKGKGLKVGRVTFKRTGKQAAGTVISQHPSRNARVPLGSAVALTVERVFIAAPVKILPMQIQQIQKGTIKLHQATPGTLRIVPPASEE